MSTLLSYAGKDRFMALPGGQGKGRNQHGKDAEHLVMEVPVGTVVFTEGENEKNEEGSKKKEEWVKLFDLDKPGEKALLAQGGLGGRGNTAFKSSTNTTPMNAEKGGWGEQKRVRLELKLLADVGLVGLPNAGKSTLLSVLTAARPEIANYPFTTITPNLGVLEVGSWKKEEGIERRQLVIADIPGLIEDAHEGKGLGIQFLKHVERCQVLVYVISPTETDLTDMEEDTLIESLVSQFKVVRREVVSFTDEMDAKSRLVVINKADVLSPELGRAVVRAFEKLGEQVALVSAASGQGITGLKTVLTQIVSVDAEKQVEKAD
jgi:GTP-binding protein